MQWCVQKLGAALHSHGDGGSHDVVVERGDYVKGYQTSRKTAETVAKGLAAKNPGVQYAVMGVISIFETTQPSFVEKVVNEAGEIVVKPAATA